METRIVTHIRRHDGRIAEIFGRGWGPVPVARAVDEIEQGVRKYAVADPVRKENPIFVVESMYGKYLKTDPNPWTNLGDLEEPPGRFGTRIVTDVHRRRGVIGELIGRDWGPVRKQTVIDEIERRLWSYAVDDFGEPNPIRVVHGEGGSYLRTPPIVERRNLGQL